MRTLGSSRHLLAWVLPALLLLPRGAEAQFRAVVSNEIAVSGREATLRLNFQDEGVLSIAFRDGQVLVDEEAVGSYTRGDALDSAWRSLLADVLALDDGPLARALYEWAPSPSLTGSGGDVARALDQTLEKALALPEAAADPGSARRGLLTAQEGGTLLGALLRRAGALEELARALEEVELEHAVIHIDEDVVVAADEVVEGTLVLVGGDLELEGRVEGDVVVVGGSVRLLEGSLVTGDLRVADGSVEGEESAVQGSFLQLGAQEEEEAQAEEAAQELESLRRDLERQIRSEVARETSRKSGGFFAPFRNLGLALAGLMENLATYVVLALLGMVAIHFGGDRLEVVALTARRAPGRSALVGMAGGFLLIPVWILGIVALVVTIIGIPVLLAWVPLFPIAATVAALFGYLAVARNVGEWVAEQEYRGLEWIRGSNRVYALLAGLGAFLAPCVAANVARLLGLGFFQGLLTFAGSTMAFLAAIIGFGAVLLTRGGRIRPHETYYEFDEEPWDQEEPPTPPEAYAEPDPAPDPAETGEGTEKSEDDHA